MTDQLSEAAFRAVVEEAPDAIIVVDRGGLVTYINSEAERLFGYRREELVGQRIEMLVPRDRGTMHTVHRGVYQEHPQKRPMGVGLELTARNRDGSVFPVEISLSPFRDGDARFTVAVVRDVTRQRASEEALRRSEQLHRLLNERAINVIFRYRLYPTPGFEYASAALRTELGYEPEELYVDSDLLRRAVHEDDRHVLDHALSASAPRTASLRLRRRDGALRWFELSVATVQNAEGIVVALEGIARDVTDRRVADEERMRLEAEVEMELERSHIAADLHDDTVQSIYAIGLGLHAARNDEAVTKQEVVDQTIRDLNTLIASLRAYMARLSGSEVRAQSQSLGERLSALVTVGGGPDWQVDVAPDLELDVDLQRELYLLGKELISNVIRHAEASSATLRLAPDADGHIALEVSDDGVGFDREAVDRASFGLRSVALRASTLGAALDLDSRPGEGTRVSVRIPARHATEEARR